jgi:hypothetical protein
MGDGVGVLQRVQWRPEGWRPAILHQLGRAFMTYEDLQAEGYGAFRRLLNQDATIEGAKR